MLGPGISDLLFHEQHQPEVEDLLESIGFEDWRSAARCFRRLGPDQARQALLGQFLPHLLGALAQAGGPDRVLATLERFLHSAGDGLDLLRFLAGQPRSVELLVRLFSGSQFLAEILLRNPEYFENLIDTRRMARPKTCVQLYNAARLAIAPHDSPIEQLDALRRFQRAELLRIGACDLFDLFDLPAATLQLSNLADSIVQVCIDICAAQLKIAPAGFVVLGMGKLGGQELNYSSDIDFLFLAGMPSPQITRLGEHLIDALARVTTEGFLYRVDMRLRPWGTVGPLVSSPDGFVNYLRKSALLWEKQALLKARVVAGDEAVGNGFLARVRPMLLEGEAESVRADVFAMKTRTENFLQQKGRMWGDVKLGEGSIRDVEFVVQYLQLANGRQRPEILSHNTLDALARCQHAGLLRLHESRVLADGYIFLRTIEHHLQMIDYRQTHTMPDDQEAIRSLARRLGFENGPQFLARYQQHAAAIREIYLHYIGSVEMKKSSLQVSASNTLSASSQEVDRHRSRMDPSYAGRFSEAEITRHAALVSQLADDRLAVVEGLPQTDDTWEVTIVAYDYPGELSLICGLLFVHGLDILKGNAFTYEPQTAPAQREDTRRKLVDVFTVRPVRGSKAGPELWLNYARDLEDLLHMMRAGQQREARGALTKRVGTSLYEAGQAAQVDSVATLFPIEIEVDNEASERYTVLRIDTPDVVGFLYEFTNALAINGVYIAQVVVDSIGSRVRDILYVTDERGQKITQPERERELRAASVLIKHFTHLLPYSPNPEAALLHFREFIAQLFRRPNWPDELASLERPEVLQAIARLLGVSDFLWDDFLRMQYTNLYPVVTDVDALATSKSRAELQAELEAILSETHQGPQFPSDDAPWRDALNAFKDREMFRIDMRHIQGHTYEFWDFAVELTDLAEVIVNAAYHLCHEDLRSVYGAPMLDDGAPCEMSVCALGKCGGRELGFASDIELMFVYSGNGKTSGPQVISSAEFYEKLVTTFVRAIRARREGIFEIDLQLRPYGKAGSLAVSLESFRRYFNPEGPAWAYERQALVKLRAIAGNPGLGDKVSELRDVFVYTGRPYDVTAMRAMRERQTRHLVTGGSFNLKYSPGGLVDVEYLVQGLQIEHGKDCPALRQTNTREAMAALAEAGVLSADDYTRLRKAHTFLRWMIDSLRVVRGNARDVTVPAEGSEEFAYLTRRVQYGHDVALLREGLAHYTADVQEINRRLLKY